MDDKQLIEKTRAFIEEKFSGEASGHDYWHMYRVWKLARHIASDEPSADLLVTELAALLHDMADWKFVGSNEATGLQEVRHWLEYNGVNNSTILQIESIVKTTSFSKSLDAKKPNVKIIEAQIVHDADLLDAIGAIGIARTFAYGGNKGRTLYDPTQKPQQYADAEAYRASTPPTINHFYEKLLLLKDHMLTKAGKQLAQHRHEYMEQFLAEFYDEWDGRL